MVNNKKDKSGQRPNVKFQGGVEARYCLHCECFHPVSGSDDWQWTGVGYVCRRDFITDILDDRGVPIPELQKLSRSKPPQVLVAKGDVF